MSERVPVPLAIHHTPICLTFAFFGEEYATQTLALLPPVATTADSFTLSTSSLPTRSSLCVLDPSHLEQQLSNGTLTVTLNSQQEICVLSKAGGVPLPADDIMKVSRPSCMSREAGCGRLTMTSAHR